MLDKLLLKAIRWAWSKFDGKKTIAGIIVKGLAYTLGAFRIIFPDINAAVPTEIDEVIDNFGNLFLAGGVAHKIEKSGKS